MTSLSTAELIRYSRHFNLDQVGLEGQECLKLGSVLLVGAGGLGSPLALYLAAAGVGRIGIVDFDVVDASNLQRQVLHDQRAVGRSKLESARVRLSELNPHIKLELHETRLDRDNALEIVGDYDVVADGADNFATRYLVNDACFLTGRPLVSGSILGFEGQLSVYNYKGGPCYRCLFPEPPPPGTVPSCAEGGVLGVLPGVIGSLQANEVIKILLGIGEVASGRLVLYDALALAFNQLRLARDPKCALCGEHPEITELIDYVHFCGAGEPDAAIEVTELTPDELRDRLDEVCLVDVRARFERMISTIAPSLHVPLAELDDHALTEAEGRPLVLYCRTGVRSMRGARKLIARGFDRVYNLKGGIHAWIDDIDPSQSKY